MFGSCDISYRRDCVSANEGIETAKDAHCLRLARSAAIFCLRVRRLGLATFFSSISCLSPSRLNMRRSSTFSQLLFSLMPIVPQFNVYHRLLANRSSSSSIASFFRRLYAPTNSDISHGIRNPKASMSGSPPATKYCRYQLVLLQTPPSLSPSPCPPPLTWRAGVVFGGCLYQTPSQILSRAVHSSSQCYWC